MLTSGMRVQFTRHHEHCIYGRFSFLVNPGLTGTIEDVSRDEDGTITFLAIRVDDYCKELDHWSNELVWTSNEPEEVESLTNSLLVLEQEPIRNVPIWPHDDCDDCEFQFSHRGVDVYWCDQRGNRIARRRDLGGQWILRDGAYGDYTSCTGMGLVELMCHFKPLQADAFSCADPEIVERWTDPEAYRKRIEASFVCAIDDTDQGQEV